MKERAKSSAKYCKTRSSTSHARSLTDDAVRVLEVKWIGITAQYVADYGMFKHFSRSL